MNTDLSAFYFDIRKDALYCEPYRASSASAALDRDRPALPPHHAVAGAAPLFTAEEAWLARYPSEDGSVHLEPFRRRARSLARRRAGREVGDTSARAPRRDGSAGDRARRQEDRLVAGGRAAVFISEPSLLDALEGVDLAEVCITVGHRGLDGAPPRGRVHARRRAGRRRGARRAEGTECARSWRITKDVGSDPALSRICPPATPPPCEFDAARAKDAV